MPKASQDSYMSPLSLYTLGSKVVVESDVEPDFIDEPPSCGAAAAPAEERRRQKPLRFRFSWRKLWRYSGPGMLMSLAYIDPGNLESNLQQGAYTHFHLVWVLWWATVIGFLLQEMSARLGLVTGRDLAQTVRDEYPEWLSRTVYMMMELAVIGADIQEVVGSGIAFNLLTNGWLPVWAGCLITGVDTLTFLAVGRLGVRYLEAFVTTLIGIMTMCFFANWYAVGVEKRQMLTGWAVPFLPAYGFTQAIGTLGAVIMPHNLYLHSGLVLSRKIKRSSATRVHEAITYSRIESAVALLLAFVINLAIVATTASRFWAAECAHAPDGPFACLSPSAEVLNGDPPNPRPAEGLGASCIVVNSEFHKPTKGHCGEIGLENAGFALADAIGPSSLYVWAVGVLAAGQASTMVCTYAGQIIMNGCLDIELPAWKRIALTRGLALGPALLVAVATTSMPGALNAVNEYLNIMQSVLLPFAMLPALHFAASSRLLGRFRSPPALLVASTALGLVVLATNAVLVSKVVEALGGSPLVFTLALIGSAMYSALCVRLVWDDLTNLCRRSGRLVASMCTLLRYKFSDCCWLLCGDNERSTMGQSSASFGTLPRIGSDLIEADATIEGELLGRLLTPDALRAAHVGIGNGSSASGGRPRGGPRSLTGDLNRASPGTATGRTPARPPPLRSFGSGGSAQLGSTGSAVSILSPTDSEQSGAFSEDEEISPTFHGRLHGAGPPTAYHPPRAPPARR